MTEDTWHNRDLPVLRAAVDIYERTGRTMKPRQIEQECGFDAETVQRALRVLNLQPYFEKTSGAFGGGILLVGAPTAEALRVAGQWPTPEGQLERLVAAFEAVAADDTRPEEERSRAAKVGLWLTGALSQVAIGALGGAGGNMMSG
ncbi:hypothetical protein [Mycolicibacterium neoaurum]|uniref:Transcriptional regulator n=1 Tax=Mycolicibacterium neoaurum TaxID=1795 RepID=A0AAV2WFW5_MYCNE|nr:hypothetical protein [Mycolicibacterium neoaurum]TLH48784.1 hypothetical protein C1S81_26035 [Mycolicibacterium neoaurum]CDQ43119.1 hypothetical protein BN1047_00981 [Mycolicibacterium neoaurum]